jgi:predicted HAD superfamily hydrolase
MFYIRLNKQLNFETNIHQEMIQQRNRTEIFVRRDGYLITQEGDELMSQSMMNYDVVYSSDESYRKFEVFFKSIMTYDDICIYSSKKLEKESVLSTIVLFPVV